MKKYLLTLTIVLLSIFSLNAARPKVVAHRGYWNTEGSAQNSLRSLIKADSIGADLAEFDVWIAGDDVPVVNHDGTVNGYVIPETTSTVLRENVRLANGEPIRTLEEYLDTARDLKVGLVFEVKWHADPAREALLIKKGIEMINERGLADRTIYITFSPNAHAELGKHGVPHYFLTGTFPDEMVKMGSDGPDFQFEVFYKNTDMIPEFKRLGMPINVWTVNTEQQLQYFIDQDIDYLTTDNPELAQRLLAETPSSVDIRVMDFNLEGAASYDAVGAIIYAESPDFVTLQGIKDATALANIAYRAGMHVYSAPTTQKNGVAILSTIPAVETKAYQLPNQWLDTPCEMLVATFDMGHGMKINVASAWGSDDNKETRRHQAQFITRHLRDSGIPSVLGIALNERPNEEAWKTLRGTFSEVGPDGFTFPAPVPDRKLDYLLAYPADKIEKRDNYFRPSAVSFHYPVITDITLKY